MRATTGRFAVFAAIIAAFIAALLHVSYLRGIQETATVVVVTKEVAAFQKLDETNTALKSVPASTAGEALTKLEDARGHYARGLVLAGEILRKDHIVEATGGAVPARLTEGGDGRMRAMALQVTPQTGVANTIQPGDRVDVLVAITGDKNVGTVSKVIAQDVEVLFTTFAKSDTMSSSSGQGSVVLQVTSKTAEEIAFAQQSGTVWLLTTPFASEMDATSGVNMAIFQERYPVAAPATLQRSEQR